MTLYLYRIGTEVPILTIENVQNYTADSVTAKNAEGNPIIYSPLAADCELSSKADWLGNAARGLARGASG